MEDLPPQLICDSFLEVFFVQPITEGLPIVGFPILQLETMFQNVLACVKEATQVTIVFHVPYKVIKNGQWIPCWPQPNFWMRCETQNCFFTYSAVTLLEILLNSDCFLASCRTSSSSSIIEGLFTMLDTSCNFPCFVIVP